MKLYLDDTRAAPPDWIPVRTVDQAKSFLRTGHVEQLSLDYDLGGDSNAMPLLDWMRDHKHWPKYAPKVHSGNVQGALAMKAFIANHAAHLDRAPAAKRGPKPHHRPGRYGRALATPRKY
jgi:hypothetical protein